MAAWPDARADEARTDGDGEGETARGDTAVAGWDTADREAAGEPGAGAFGAATPLTTATAATAATATTAAAATAARMALITAGRRRGRRGSGPARRAEPGIGWAPSLGRDAGRTAMPARTAGTGTAMPARTAGTGTGMPARTAGTGTGTAMSAGRGTAGTARTGTAAWRPRRPELVQPGPAGVIAGCSGPAPRPVPQRTDCSWRSVPPDSSPAPWPGRGRRPRADQGAAPAPKAGARIAARTSPLGADRARRAASRRAARTRRRPANTGLRARRGRAPRSAPAPRNRTIRTCPRPSRNRRGTRGWPRAASSRA